MQQQITLDNKINSFRLESIVMATIKDVARVANVSVATVSRVLNGSPKVSEHTRNAVLEARKQLGFFLNANARALAQQDSHTIGVTVADISDPYFGYMVRSCETVAHSFDCTLLVGQGLHQVEREVRAIEDLLSYQCRGLVVHALAIPDDLMKEYMERTPYMVLVNRILIGYEDRCVTLDNLKGSMLAVQELIDNGHTRIAYVNSCHNILDADERLDGFLRCMRHSGLRVNEDLIVSCEPYIEGGTVAANLLLPKIGQLTALGSYYDVIAAGLMARFVEEGIRIPEDVSVIGFDNLYLSQCLNPPLSTVINPIEEMAREAILLSTALYENRVHRRCCDTDVKLVRRKSVKNLLDTN